MNLQESDETKTPFLIKAIVAAAVVVVVQWLWPETIPFKTLDVWSSTGSMSDWLITASPYFCFGAVFSLLIMVWGSDDTPYRRSAGNSPMTILKKGFVISVWAGIAEEISFRWLIFYGAIITATITNYILGGFAGYGIMEFLYLKIVGPVANWATLGYLENMLFYPEYWTVGAGIISANAGFRDGHSYQGIFGWIDSWFFGMFMFYLMFQYGLIACIVVHFAYNMMLFIIGAIAALIR